MSEHGIPSRPWRVAITGSSGLVGSALATRLESEGHSVLRLVRGRAGAGEAHWDPERGQIDAAPLEGLSAVVNLAGENIGQRWTPGVKERIRRSRVEGTALLAGALASLREPPDVLINASAMGFYGDRGDDILTETSPPGDTFLADVSKEWETESRRAEDSGIRTVLLRTSIVLSKDGGALATMMTPFKFGVGGVIGSGKQWMSWISLDDVIRIINFAIENEKLRGAVNVASPNPVTNEEFTKTLGDVLYRPTFLPLPEFAVNLVFGEMGDALLIDSMRLEPKRLKEAGYEFKFNDLKSALENAVK